MNYIHDLTEEQCLILSQKVLLCCNSSNKGAEEASEALLLFLLSDTRAKQPEKQFEMLLEPDILRADISGKFPIFTATEATSLDFSKVYKILQNHWETTFPSDKFTSASKAWEEWHAPFLQLEYKKKMDQLIQEEIDDYNTRKLNQKQKENDTTNSQLYAVEDDYGTGKRKGKLHFKENQHQNI